MEHCVQKMHSIRPDAICRFQAEFYGAAGGKKGRPLKYRGRIGISICRRCDEKAYPQIGRGLVNRLLDGHRIEAAVQRGAEHVPVLAHPLASQQRR